MIKDKVILVMPGEIGFYLRDKLPGIIANLDTTQDFFQYLFLHMKTLPLQFLAIAPYLQRAGFEVVIIDGRIQNARKQLAEEIDDRVVYVGITALSGSMVKYGLYCAEVVRRLNPVLPIVWGGVHVTLSAEQALQTSDLVDIVVRGEGEFTAVELAQTLVTNGDLSSVKGLSWKSNGKSVHNPDRPFMNFDEQLPFDYSLLPIEKYNTNDVLLYQSERGCPHRCAFCDVVIVHRRMMRQKSAQRVLDDLKSLYERFHPTKVHFVDDCFFADLHRAQAVIEGLIEMKTDMQWHASCRAQYTRRTDKAFWERARASGLCEVYVGAESGSQKILDYIKKDCTLDDVDRAAEQICGAGIHLMTNFMTGFPIEDREDLNKTADLIDRLDRTYKDKISVGRIFLYAPCPGTPLHHEVVEAGFRPPSTLRGWGDFRIGDMSHTLWHPDIKYFASATLCSKYGRNLQSGDVAKRLKGGLRRYSLVVFLRLLVLKLPEFLTVLLSRRAGKKWPERDFRYTWDMKMLRWLNMTFDSW